MNTEEEFTVRANSVIRKMKFQKFDDNKPKFHLIDPYWHEGVAEVLTFGAEKYSEDNWKNDVDLKRYISSLERHINEIKKGNFFDDETNLQHAAHIACNSMFLHYMIRNKDNVENKK
jgi:hypothetical protein